MNGKRGIGGEAAVLNAFIKHGYDVSVPFGDGHPYDLVVDTGAELLRVQCKTAWRSSGCLLFNAYATDHGRGQVSYDGRADLFGVYLPPTEAVYVVPVGETASDGRLRLEPTRNNQSRRVRLAADYEFARWAARVKAAPSGAAVISA